MRTTRQTPQTGGPQPPDHGAVPGHTGADEAPTWNSWRLTDLDGVLSGGGFDLFGQITGQVGVATDKPDIPESFLALAGLDSEADAVIGSLDGAGEDLSGLSETFPDHAAEIAAQQARFQEARYGAKMSAARDLVLQNVPVDTYQGRSLPAPVRPAPDSFLDLVHENTSAVRELLTEAEAVSDFVSAGAAADGQFAFDIAADLVTGPLSVFAIGTANEEYLYQHVKSSQVSRPVVNKVAFLTGRETPYPQFEGFWSQMNDLGYGMFGGVGSYGDDLSEDIVGEGASRVDPWVNPWTFGPQQEPQGPFGPQMGPMGPLQPWEPGFDDETLGRDVNGLPVQGTAPLGKAGENKIGAEHEGHGTRLSKGVATGKGEFGWGRSATDGQEFSAGGSIVENRDDHSSESWGGKVKIDTEGPNSATFEKKSTDTKGRENSTAVTMDTDGKVGIEKKVPVGEKGAVTGSVEFDPWGDDKSVAGSLGYEKNGYSIKASGNKQVVISKPVQKDKAWVVAYEIRYGGGAEGGKSTKDKSAGVKAGFKVDRIESGTKVFGTQPEAQAFYDQGSVGPTDPDLSVDEVLAMAPGEERSEVTGKGGSFGATGKMGMVSLGADASAKGTSGKRVVRGQGNEVLVEVSETSGKALSGNVGVGVAGAFKGVHKGDAHSRTYAFDLGTPEGKLAYTMYTRTGSVPKSMGGFKEVARNDSETKGDSWGMSFTPALGYSESSTVTSGTMFKDGVKNEYDIGTQSSRLAIWGLGHLGRSHTLNAWQVDDKEQFYTLASTIDASDSDDAALNLQKSTEFSHADPKGDADGKWTVRSSLSETQMESFIRYAKSDSFGWKTDAWFNNYGDDLKASLRAARGDKDKERRAVAVFVSEAGVEALESIRDVTRGADDYHLELAGDAYWTGLKGSIEMEALIREWTARLNDPKADKWAVYYEAQEKAVYLREKVDALPKYRDVPDHLLLLELTRSRETLARVNDLMQAAMQLPTEGEPRDQKRAMTGDPVLAAVSRARGQMVQERVEADDIRRYTVRYYEAIEQGYRGKESGKAGEIMRKAKDENWKKYLDKAKADYDTAEQYYAAAEAAEKELDTSKLEDDSRRALALSLRAKSTFFRSKGVYKKSFDLYKKLSDQMYFTLGDQLYGTTRVKPM